MGQKVHPTGFRIGVTETHRSQWFAKPNEVVHYFRSFFD